MVINQGVFQCSNRLLYVDNENRTFTIEQKIAKSHSYLNLFWNNKALRQFVIFFLAIALKKDRIGSNFFLYYLSILQLSLYSTRIMNFPFSLKFSAEYYDNGHCHACHSTCETCIGPTEADCLTCSSALLLQNSKCVNSCDDGYYMEAGVCAKCLHTCTHCVSRMNCTACAKGLQLQSGECRTTCAEG